MSVNVAQSERTIGFCSISEVEVRVSLSGAVRQVFIAGPIKFIVTPISFNKAFCWIKATHSEFQAAKRAAEATLVFN
jgi:hypothetical protein